MKNKTLEKAEIALANFLKENPHLQSYQDKITRCLSKAPSPEARMEILKMMAQEKILELATKIEEIKKHLENQFKFLQGAIDNGNSDVDNIRSV